MWRKSSCCSFRSTRAVNSLRKSLSEFVNLTYQFTQYTEARADRVSEWPAFVHQLQEFEVLDSDSAHGEPVTSNEPAA